MKNIIIIRVCINSEENSITFVERKMCNNFFYDCALFEKVIRNNSTTFIEANYSLGFIAAEGRYLIFQIMAGWENIKT